MPHPFMAAAAYGVLPAPLPGEKEALQALGGGSLAIAASECCEGWPPRTPGALCERSKDLGIGRWLAARCAPSSFPPGVLRTQAAERGLPKSLHRASAAIVDVTAWGAGDSARVGILIGPTVISTLTDQP